MDDMDDFDMDLGVLEDMNFNTGTQKGRENKSMMFRIERAEMEIRRAREQVRAAQERLNAAARTLADLKGSGSSTMKMRYTGLSSNFNQPSIS